MNFETKLNNYARLAVEVGVNIKKDQLLVINSPIECAEFARLASKHAYELGAKNVEIVWNDEEANLIKYLHAPEKAFEEYPEWAVKRSLDAAKDGAAFLSISASNPDLLKSVDPKRVAMSQKTASLAMKEFRSYTMSDKNRWCVLSVPSKAWACKVFPDVSEEEAISMLWDKIFYCARVDEGDAVANWEAHNQKLSEKQDFLNEQNFRSLKFKSGKTDLTMGLPKGHIWKGGGGLDTTGVMFNANIPTEEIFTLPHKFEVNGVVHSTKPLVYGGNVINDFSLTFKDGKVVEYSAKEGLSSLENLLNVDEGARYLGEVALVPVDSPISNTNVTFFNTLYDENASCHFAFGMAYKSSIENGIEIADADCDAYGINTSLTHVDFMIGSSDMNITGVKENGEEVAIFVNGNWA